MEAVLFRSSHYTDLIQAWQGFLPGHVKLGGRLLVADVDARPQRLAFLEAGVLQAEYRVSAARNGVGSASGSFNTPPGWHRIHAKVGRGCAIGTAFKGQRPDGRIWKEGGPAFPALILTRILVLQGLEPGVNLGRSVDSLRRSIYIHGTNCVKQLGSPASHGCIRMHYREVADLFDRVQTGDTLLIAGGTPV